VFCLNALTQLDADVDAEHVDFNGHFWGVLAAVVKLENKDSTLASCDQKVLLVVEMSLGHKSDLRQICLVNHIVALNDKSKFEIGGDHTEKLKSFWSSSLAEGRLTLYL